MNVNISDDSLNFDNAPLVAHITGVWFDGQYAPEIGEKTGPTSL